MTILVTGGAGFIGSHLCERLIKEDYNLICVDNLTTGLKITLNSLLKNPRFKFINHDVVKPLNIKSKVDAIFHLASPASPNHHSKISYLALPMATMLVNTTGTLNCLELAKRNHARFLFASTSEVYGNPLEHPQKESYNGNVSTTSPRAVYDEAKRFGETISYYFYRNEKVDVRIARIFNTYGPRMLKADMRMIIKFVTQAISGKPLTIYGNGKQTRSLCYIDDMVVGLMRLMFYPNTKGEIINLGSEKENTVLQYAQMIIKLTGSKSKIIFSEPLPENDPLQRRPDISKAKKLLNWKPKTSLEIGLQKMINYIYPSSSDLQLAQREKAD
ncbi:NAD-dependent dehydratase [Candidatus Roizmanbacteria bacterium RIFCSPHIGHO2_01_FULL_39_12c]|uniref:UDP-glucuronate decarboxylase n=1 Tax=Candidatus Roizmanbacteria bacterium RIFCSPHIGHO2_01_FULL_39_12c TaxID=1802031 RepID=A0A1F7GEA2_9BACT|nr:MAG: NAD-dependent dehydratase [Candidatus Roizmanbacteria bacterium RIFCSPHIGHO2_01_FULL_39_12c]OGK47606.1 MAG: NAD-dependent dehydratase [Candidatus Roizmanbacteria bacterium RIFCSPLOWO2_01_FULL_40_13]